MSRGIHRALDKNGPTGSSLGVNAHKPFGIFAEDKLTHHEEPQLSDKIHRRQLLHVLGLWLAL